MPALKTRRNCVQYSVPWILWESLTVFNIGGNKFRLIAGVDYRCQIVYVKHILSSQEIR